MSVTVNQALAIPFALGVGAGKNTVASGATTITALGDSISAQSIYFPVGYVNANITSWTAATAYVSNQVVQYNGFFFRCPSGATSGATPPTPSATNDGTINWTWLTFNCTKQGTSYLFWAEAFSNQRMRWDMSQGYAGPWFGIQKIIVRNGGSGYSPADTPIFDNGAKGTLTVAGGVITAVSVTSPGYATGGVHLTGITTSTGSGAQFTVVQSCAGSFAVPGASTTDMVAFLPDAVASAADIFVIMGGTNDVAAAVGYATITANLKTCYETLMNVGKKVIAVPIPPRSIGVTTATRAVLVRVNQWIRAYARGESWANPGGFKNISLADATGFLTDGASATNAPIGGNGGVAGAMMQDGVHPSERGAMYIGYAVWQAAQQFIGATPSYPARIYNQFDGYDPVNNPGGNMLEGLPWTASTVYALGALASNSGNVYYCVQAGTSAASGGPTGTGSNIVDNAARWTYSGWPSGMSVLASAATALASPPGGITYSGNYPAGYGVLRQGGSASGTVTGTIENPWSSGQAGQRWKLDFVLGSGTSSELWRITMPFKNVANWGILPADLGVVRVEMEAELEISGVANMNYLQLYGPQGAQFYGAIGPQNGGVGRSMMNSAGEMLAIPNGGKFLLRAQSMLLPAGETTLSGNIYIGFDASGGAGSATGTVRVNYVALRRAN